jgi:NADP-dependent 3-hydroxy acid dehydrogenase YdfG
MTAEEHLSPTALERSRKLRKLLSAGTNVLIEQADVADLEAMKSVVQKANSKFGSIDGVFHAAGVLQDSLLTNMSTKALSEVLRPKIAGTLVLDRALEVQNLDFMVLFGSLVGLAGNPGQANYAAANRFLDSYAAFESSSGRRTISIDWPPWTGEGMASKWQKQPNKLRSDLCRPVAESKL